MREIKFRTWDTERKIMAQVNYLGLNDYEVGMKAKCEHWNAPYPYVCKLMQYTGLKDKNGKEIYEGDIVKLYSTETDELSSENYTITYTKDAEWSLDDFYLLSRKYRYCEVIGNLYENKDLLK